MIGQTRRRSAIEAIMNVIIWYVIALCAQLVIFPIFGGHFTIEQNLKIGALFTLVSLARSYLLRRLFNHIALGKGRIHD